MAEPRGQGVAGSRRRRAVLVPLLRLGNAPAVRAVRDLPRRIERVATTMHGRAHGHRRRGRRVPPRGAAHERRLRPNRGKHDRLSGRRRFGRCRDRALRARDLWHVPAVEPAPHPVVRCGERPRGGHHRSRAVRRAHVALVHLGCDRERADLPPAPRMAPTGGAERLGGAARSECRSQLAVATGSGAGERPPSPRGTPPRRSRSRRRGRRRRCSRRESIAVYIEWSWLL